ncbi:MAG: tetratricopeptide repeat protein [Planctomycetota bacterium]
MAVAVGLLACGPTSEPAAAEELAFEDGRWVETTAPGEGTTAAALAEIRLLLRTDELREAFRAARAFVREHPDDPLVAEALFLAGEAQLHRERWWSAYEWFERLIARDPIGPLYERALRREAVIGEAFLAGAKRPLWGVIPLPATDEGIEILQRVADRLPGSALAARSLMRIGDFQFARKRWVEATATYQAYIERFRGRYRSGAALLKAARATYAQFGDVHHDDTPLIEAAQLYRQYLAQYDDTAGADEAAAALRTIRNLQAEKDYRTGRFYERIGRPDSARVYYRDVIGRYPDTPWATQSGEALEALGTDRDREQIL